MAAHLSSREADRQKYSSKKEKEKRVSDSDEWAGDDPVKCHPFQKHE